MSRKTERYRRRTPAEWQAILERQAVSGLSQEAFCSSEGIALSTFARWKSRLAGALAAREPDRSPPSELFAKLALPAEARSCGPASPAERGWDIELELGAGVCLRIRRGAPC